MNWQPEDVIVLLLVVAVFILLPILMFLGAILA